MLTGHAALRSSLQATTAVPLSASSEVSGAGVDAKQVVAVTDLEAGVAARENVTEPYSVVTHAPGMVTTAFPVLQNEILYGLPEGTA